MLKTKLGHCKTNGLADNKLFMDLMIKMLKIDPKKRISPDDIIKHPFCLLTSTEELNC